MKYRSLGRTGVRVSPLCLGCMNFGDRTDEKDGVKIIDAALEDHQPPHRAKDNGAARG